MNFIEACILTRQDKFMKRKDWANSVYIYARKIDHGHNIVTSPPSLGISVDDVVANDWEERFPSTKEKK